MWIVLLQFLAEKHSVPCPRHHGSQIYDCPQTFFFEFTCYPIISKENGIKHLEKKKSAILTSIQKNQLSLETETSKPKEKIMYFIMYCHNYFLYPLFIR